MPQTRRRSPRAVMRARYRQPRRRRGGSLGWNMAIAVVVIAGVVAVILTRSSNEELSNIRPLAANQAENKPGDHWHTFLGVNICGEWIPPAPAFEKAFNNQGSVSNVGIHSHGDGLIHTHPFFSSEEGNKATLGHYLGNGGWSVSDESIDIGSGY